MTVEPPPEGGSSRALGPWLEVRTGRHHDVLEVSVLGEIDLANHQALQHLLSSLDLAGAPRVDVDLSQLSFSDARGACHLLDFVDRTGAGGCDVRIIGAQPGVSRLLGLLTQLPDSA